MPDKKYKVCLITTASQQGLSAFATYIKMMKVLGAVSGEVVWLATNSFGDESMLPSNTTMVKLELEHEAGESFFKRVVTDLGHELKIISEMRRLKDVEVFVFYGWYVPLFPIMYAGLFKRAKVIIRMEGRSSIVIKKRLKAARTDNRLLRILAHSFIERVTYCLAAKIAIEYSSMVDYFEMQKYRRKIVLGNQYVDTARFIKTQEASQRTYLLGFFGRLSQEKGTLEFARALPDILKERTERVVIVGDGTEREAMEKSIAGIREKIDFVKWLPHESMPDYLNNTMVAVVPSYSEGVPNIILEAMACGTIVLATPVGGIPEVVKDGETGFIMEDNSPECISRNVSRVLKYPDLDKIARNARAFIEKEYDFNVVVDRYRRIINA